MADDRIGAVLTPWQLERFCAVFRVTPPELEVDFSGWHKITILAKDAVYLFPRTPPHARALGRELAVYEWLGGRGPVPVPRLVARARDREISYYEIGVISRLPGVPFARCMPGITPEQRAAFLLQLSETVAAWHSMPTRELPAALRLKARRGPAGVTLASWHRRVLCAGSSADAVGFIHRFVRRLAKGGLPGALSNEAATLDAWTVACAELAALPHVLVHGDVHESHVMVDPGSLAITGIIDWESARVDNPVWDFNFGEWGTGICQWWDELPALRLRMWERYLACRGLAATCPEALNLFYTLWDLLWLVHFRRESGRIVTGTDYRTAVDIHLEKLAAVTGRL